MDGGGYDNGTVRVLELGALVAMWLKLKRGLHESPMLAAHIYLTTSANGIAPVSSITIWMVVIHCVRLHFSDISLCFNDPQSCLETQPR